jgi:ABC-type nitrate/sulfonate/bicarbonate transport system substrate-binding protein
VETGLILSAIANGAEGLRIIATHSKRLHFAFYAKNDIKDLKGMYGRTFAISGIGGLPHLVMLALYERAGLDADRLQLLTVGGTGARLSALMAGKSMRHLASLAPPSKPIRVSIA